MNLTECLNRIETGEVYNVLRELVQRDSQIPGGSEYETALYCEAYLKELGYEVERIPLVADRMNLLAKKRGIGGKDPILFCGHMDVVPVTEESIPLWTYPPFSGEIHDGYLWGRGACDMKGGIAAAMVAAKLVSELDVQLQSDVYFLLTVDEEAYMQGAKQLASLNVVPDNAKMIVCDTSHLSAMVASKGRSWADITVFGKTAHASIEGAGINAIEKAIALVQRIKAIPKTSYPGAGNSFFNIAAINAGIEPAIVPDRCVITVDARLVPGQTCEAIWQSVQEQIDALHAEDPDFSAEICVLERREPWMNHKECELLDMLKNVEQTLNITVPLETEQGTTDATFLKKEGLEVIILGPGEVAHCHCVDERVSLRDLDTAVRIYVSFLLQLI